MLGTKQNMTQVWNEEGVVSPSTILVAGPITVVGIKTKERDGYDAVQVGFGERSQKNIAKAQQGQWKDLGNFRFVKEFRSNKPVEMKVGDKLDVSLFEVGDTVQVSGISKGKGFQGGVKRHGFSGGPRTHGQKHSEREPGSIGATGPQRVFKGTRMAGRMGADRVTVKNLKVLGVDAKNSTLLLSGAIPGRRGTLIEILGFKKSAVQ